MRIRYGAKIGISPTESRKVASARDDSAANLKSIHQLAGKRMGKPEQILIIFPQNELRFRGPFTGTSVTSYLKITNPSDCMVYFKIKTTVPKRYCVRPNCGVIRPQDMCEIAVTLQPFDFDPAEKNKHKFMVQSAIVPDDVSDDYTELWKSINPDDVMDSKLKCVFENPVSNTNKAESAVTSAAAKSDSDTNHEKNKGLGDSVKSSPKLLGETEEKLMKAAQEVNQLRVEESKLRQENLQLREDLMKVRNLALGSSANPAAAKGLASQSSNQLSLTSPSIVIGVVMVILGYLLGKLI